MGITCIFNNLCYDGISFAAPFVKGTIALLCSIFRYAKNTDI
jgi:hypothetical protein